MQMQKPTKFHAKLEAFTGKWTGEETMHPTPWEPSGGQAKGDMKVRSDLEGQGIIQDYVQKRGGKVSYRGHGIMGYDPQEKCYVWHWSDSMSGVPCTATRGEWRGNKLVFQNASPDGHQRYTYTFHKDGTLGFSIESSGDGSEWQTFLTARYQKKDA